MVEQETDLKQLRHGWSQPRRTCNREIVVALLMGLESTPHLKVAATRYQAKVK
jgi:hypothetical protein